MEIKKFMDIMKVSSVGPGNQIELKYPEDHPKYDKRKFIFFSPGEPLLANLPFLINENEQVMVIPNEKIGIIIKILNNKREEEEFKRNAEEI